MATVARSLRFTVDVAINQDLKALIPRPTLSADFLHAWLHGHEAEIAASATGSTVKRIRVGQLDGGCLLPPLPEQKKIAAILSSVDEAIQATQLVIDQTRRVKEGLLQDLLTRGLPGHTRFKQTEIGEIP
ncbi:MAG: restriction endonuclease subunit S [Sandaracinaceae bacterium]|nr:restriction endonuclease subunit S [Sandaracinaceae bacterium]